jgi:uncharacterized protein (DUF169 family)
MEGKMNLQKASSVMKEILGLQYEPIAVKFLEDKTDLEGFEMPSDRRREYLLSRGSLGVGVLRTSS